MTFRDIVREYFPKATDDECDEILWNHTGFPFFWHGDPPTACRSQVCALATLGPLRMNDLGQPLKIAPPQRLT